jgi:hypothetical protein
MNTNVLQRFDEKVEAKLKTKPDRWKREELRRFNDNELTLRWSSPKQQFHVLVRVNPTVEQTVEQYARMVQSTPTPVKIANVGDDAFLSRSLKTTQCTLYFRLSNSLIGIFGDSEELSRDAARDVERILVDELEADKKK